MFVNPCITINNNLGNRISIVVILGRYVLLIMEDREEMWFSLMPITYFRSQVHHHSSLAGKNTAECHSNTAANKQSTNYAKIYKYWKICTHRMPDDSFGTIFLRKYKNLNIVWPPTLWRHHFLLSPSGQISPRAPAFRNAWVMYLQDIPGNIAWFPD